MLDRLRLNWLPMLAVSLGLSGGVSLVRDYGVQLPPVVVFVFVAVGCVLAEMLQYVLAAAWRRLSHRPAVPER